MKEQISTLVDGELHEDEADSLIAKMAKDDQARVSWETYNLIGDALRGNSEFNSRLQQRISAKLAEEPTILAPKRRNISNNVSKIGWALAASVATFSVATWMHKQEVATSSQFAQNAPVVMQTAANDTIQSSNNLNEYLSAHEEFQPSTSGYRHAEIMNTMLTGTNGQ